MYKSIVVKNAVKTQPQYRPISTIKSPGTQQKADTKEHQPIWIYTYIHTSIYVC